MEHIKLAAQPRTVTGKAVRRLRREGIIPVVIYGGNVEGGVSLQVNERELQRVLHHAGGVRVIDIDVEGGKRYPVLARVVDRHPLRHEVMHVDFLAVRLDQPIEAEVSVVLIGESEAVGRNEAVLMQVLESVTVSALPDSLPASVELDISSLTEIGQQLTVADLKAIKGVTLVTDGEAMIASLVALGRTLEEEDAAEAAGDEAESDDDA